VQKRGMQKSVASFFKKRLVKAVLVGRREAASQPKKNQNEKKKKKRKLSDFERPESEQKTRGASSRRIN